MKASSEEIYSKSTICDFLLLSNNNRGRITYGWRDIFASRGWKSPFSPTVFWLSTPSGGTPSNISTCLSSFVLPLLSLKSAKSREIPRKFELIALQGHPRSSTLVPMESAYATSYWSLIVTLDVSHTVSEILTHKARRSLMRGRPYCLLTSPFYARPHCPLAFPS